MTANDEEGTHYGFEYRRFIVRELELDQFLSRMEKDKFRIVSYRFWLNRKFHGDKAARTEVYEILAEKAK